jgi:hypothetical protein
LEPYFSAINDGLKAQKPSGDPAKNARKDGLKAQKSTIFLGIFAKKAHEPTV